MTIREAKIYIRTELSDFYPENEISSFSRIIFSDLFRLSSVELISKEKESFGADNLTMLKETLVRLKNQEPLQYIIGHTEFYGLNFNVSPAVLIPRPETEELVDLIIEENKTSTASTSSVSENSKISVSEKGLKILDIGTGSGCIAVSLAKNLPNAQLFALDISSDALELAKSNAFDNGVEVSAFDRLSQRITEPELVEGGVSFIQDDILNYRKEFYNETFDIIVSNPPYVTISEKQQMERNVLDFEPGLALFVDNDSPLIFYKAITKFAKQHLSANGKLYFEINEQFGKEVKEILLSFGFSDVEVVKDITGRDRIVRGLLRQAQ